MLLSSVAERVYWFARYVERVENTARLILVNNNLLLDMPSEKGKHWEPLIIITGDQALFERKCPDCAHEQEAVIRFLAFDREYPNSILSCLAAARENGMSYSVFMNGLKKASIDIDRKVLADIAVFDKPAFSALVEKARAGLDAAA